MAVHRSPCKIKFQTHVITCLSTNDSEVSVDPEWLIVDIYPFQSDIRPASSSSSPVTRMSISLATKILTVYLLREMRLPKRERLGNRSGGTIAAKGYNKFFAKYSDTLLLVFVPFSRAAPRALHFPSQTLLIPCVP